MKLRQVWRVMEMVTLVGLVVWLKSNMIDLS